MIVIGTEIRTDGQALNRDLRRDSAAIESSLGGAFATVARAGAAPLNVLRDIGGAATSLVGRLTSIDTIVRGTAVGLVARFGLDQLDDAINSAGQLDVQLDGLANSTGKTRGQVNLLLSEVNDASAGFLDFQLAAQVTGRALLAGIPEQAIEDITRYAARIAVARGEADRFEQQLPQLFKTLAGGETGLLKDFGVFIDPADLQGIEFAERNARILELTLDQLQAKSERLGTTGDELFFRYTGIFGSIEDIRVSLAGWVLENETIVEGVDAIADIAAGIADQLRRDDPSEVLAALFERLLQLGGAAGADIGEAIAIGITRGVREGLELLGADFDDILPPDLAERANAFADQDIDFSRTGTRFNELRDDLTGPAPERIGSEDLSAAQVREIRREVTDLQRRLRDTTPGTDVSIEIQQEIVEQSRRAGLPLNTQRDDRIREIESELTGLRDQGRDVPDDLAAELRRLRSDRASDNRDGGELRRLASQLATGEGRDLDQARLRERRDDLRAGVPRDQLDVEDIERRAREALEERRDEIIINLGLGDVRTLPETSDESTGIDDDDSLLQRVGKAISTGLATEADELRDQLVAAFEQGAIVGAEVITGNVLQWGADAASGAIRVVEEYDWAALGTRIFDTLFDQDWAAVGRRIYEGFQDIAPGAIETAAEAGADAGDAIADATGFGQFQRDAADSVLLPAIQILDPLVNGQQPDFDPQQIRRDAVFDLQTDDITTAIDRAAREAIGGGGQGLGVRLPGDVPDSEIPDPFGLLGDNSLPIDRPTPAFDPDDSFRLVDEIERVRSPSAAPRDAARDEQIPSGGVEPQAERLAASGEAASEALQQGADQMEQVLAAACALNEQLGPIAQELESAARSLE